MRETGRVSTRLGSLEKQVDRFTGSLEGFLRQIRIDDTLRLVPERQRVASVEQEDLDLDETPLDLDLEPAAMLEELEDSAMDVSRLASPAPPSATTPSDAPVELRMEEPTRLFLPDSGSDSGTPEVPPAGDVEMGPPLVPTVQLIPATPQSSQDAAGQSAPILPQVPDPEPIQPPPPSTRQPSPADAIPPPRLGMGRVRSPLPSQLAAELRASIKSTSSRLSPTDGPQTRSRSRSRPPV